MKLCDNYSCWPRQVTILQKQWAELKTVSLYALNIFARKTFNQHSWETRRNRLRNSSVSSRQVFRSSLLRWTWQGTLCSSFLSSIVLLYSIHTQIKYRFCWKVNFFNLFVSVSCRTLDRKIMCSCLNSLSSRRHSIHPRSAKNFKI